MMTSLNIRMKPKSSGRVLSLNSLKMPTWAWPRFGKRQGTRDNRQEVRYKRQEARDKTQEARYKRKEARCKGQEARYKRVFSSFRLNQMKGKTIHLIFKWAVIGLLIFMLKYDELMR